MKRFAILDLPFAIEPCAAYFAAIRCAGLPVQFALTLKVLSK